MMAKSAAGVIHKMSASLQIEVVMKVHAHWLHHIWFLRGAEPACLVQLALRMEPFVFAPGELPEPTCLYVIHRGIVMYGLHVLTSGRGMWGDDMILRAAHPSTAGKHRGHTVARCVPSPTKPPRSLHASRSHSHDPLLTLTYPLLRSVVVDA